MIPTNKKQIITKIWSQNEPGKISEKLSENFDEHKKIVTQKVLLKICFVLSDLTGDIHMKL